LLQIICDDSMQIYPNFLDIWSASRMTNHRPLGVMLIAGYFCLKAAVLSIAIAIAYTSPELQPDAKDLIAYLVPMITKLHIGSIDFVFALPFALLRLAVGLGIWFLKKWARTLVVLDLSWAFCRAAIGLAMYLSIDHKLPPLPSSSLYLTIDVIISAYILVYLLDSDVKRTFGVRE
jgi:hypothetical protein